MALTVPTAMRSAAGSPAQTPRADRVAARRGRSLAGDDRMWRWAIFSPALLLMLALSVLPLANLFLTSFYDVTWAHGQAIWTLRGFANYAALPGDALFRAGLVNTLIFAVGAVGGQMVLGLLPGAAVQPGDAWPGIYRTVLILPILIPGIVVGAIWKLMFNYDFGLINQVIGLLGFARRTGWAPRRPRSRRWSVVDIWHWTPFCFLLFLAGIELLPQDVYEAARIDGASIWQELRYVTLPLMLPTIVVTSAFRLMVAFKVFDEVYLLTGGGPGTATEVLSFTIYQRFFTENRVGYGAAMSVAVIFLVALLLVTGMSARQRVADAGMSVLTTLRNRGIAGHAALILPRRRSSWSRWPGSSPPASARRSHCSWGHSGSPRSWPISTRCCSPKPPTSWSTIATRWWSA